MIFYIPINIAVKEYAEKNFGAKSEEKTMKNGAVALVLKVENVKILPVAVKIINSMYDSVIVEDK